MNEMSFFSDDLPFRVPIWQSLMLSKRKFSIYQNRIDLNSITNFGGHMFNYNKKEDKFESIKNDSFFNILFKPDSCLLPFRIKCDNSNENILFKTDCLVIDDENKMIINTNSYNHNLKQSLIFKYFNENFDNYDNGDNSFELLLLTRHGNIEKVNKFISLNHKKFNHIRQEKMITIFELKNEKQNLIINKLCEYLLENLNNQYFYSDQNLMISNLLVGSHDTNNNIKLTEIDFNVNKKIWEKVLFSNEPIQLNYSNFHPKLFFYLSNSQLNLYDTRIENNLNSIFDKQKLNCLYDFETFKSFSSLSLNPNYFCLTTNYNFFIGDYRYPNLPLLNWNHTLENKTDICFIKEIEFNNQNLIFVGNKEEISFVSLNKASNSQHPKMQHIPFHLNKINDLTQNSSIVDLKLQNYLNKSKIVGLDFLIKDDNFRIFLMNQFGDIFYQKFSKSQPFNENENPFLNFNSSFKQDLDNKLDLIKQKLFNLRKNYINKIGFYVRREVKDKTFWLNFNQNLDLNENDKISQEINEQKTCLDTNSLAKIIDDATESDDSGLKKKLVNIFKEETKEFITNDLLELKWSDFSYKLLNAWQFKRINFSQFNKELSSQNIDLNKYI